MQKQDIRRRVRAAVPTMPHREAVRRIALFGSHLRGGASPQSDIDLLVEFSQPLGYFALVGMQRHLEQSLGKRVDLLTPAALSKYFRDDVLREAEVLYES